MQVIDDGGGGAVLVSVAGAAVTFAVFLTADLVPLVWPLRLLLGLVSVTAFGVVPFLISDWRRRARVMGVPRVQHLRDVATGTAVRLAGVIEADGDSFAAAGSGRAAVYARTVFFPDRTAGRDENEACEDVRGVPFRLRLEDGACVKIDPADVRLVEQARAVRGVTVSARRALGAVPDGWLLAKPVRQAALAPGDLVEAAGRVVRLVTPEGEGGPGRGTPVGFALVPGADGHVWLRRR